MFKVNLGNGKHKVKAKDPEKSGNTNNVKCNKSPVDLKSQNLFASILFRDFCAKADYCDLKIGLISYSTQVSSV